jgi:hypothetical protein
VLLLLGCLTTVQGQQTPLAELVDRAGAGSMMGDWVGEGENGETINMSIAWDLDKHMILLHRKDPRWEVKSMTAVDPESGEVKYVGVSNRGNLILGSWTGKDSQPVLKVNVRGGEGRSWKGALLFKAAGDQTLQVEYYATDDSDNLVEPARRTYTFKRKK